MPFAVVLLAAAPAAAARDLHVPGDHRSFIDAAEAAAPGDRILLHRGRHRADFTLAVDGVTVEGDGRARVVARRVRGSVRSLRVDGEGVTLRGLSFRKCGVTVGADGVHVEDCTFTAYRDRQRDGTVLTVLGDGAIVEGNAIGGAVRAGEAIAVTGDDAVVAGNVVEAGVRRVALSARGAGARVEGNTVVVAADATGIRCAGAASVVRGNDVTGADLRVEGDGHRVEANVLSGAPLGRAAISVEGDANDVRGNDVRGGRDTAFLVVGDANVLASNSVSGNGSVLDGRAYGHGFVIRGSGNLVEDGAVADCAAEAYRVAGNGSYALAADEDTGALRWQPAPLGPGNRLVRCTATGAGGCGVVNLTVATSVTGSTFVGNGVDVAGGLPFAVFVGNAWDTGDPGDPGPPGCGTSADTWGASAPSDDRGGPPAPPPGVAAPRMLSPEDFAAGPPLATGRAHHTATPVSGGRVLVAGGQTLDGTPLGSAEIWLPGGPAFAPTAPMATPRRLHAAAALADGRVLVCGGHGPDGRTLSAAEIWDPATGAWSPAAAMAEDRSRHTATPLPGGRVLVAGGYTNATGVLAFATTTEIYDFATDAWLPGPPPVVPRGGHTATVLPGGRVLLVGGARFAQRVAEVFDPVDSVLRRTAGDPAHHRVFHGAASDQSGRVVIAGGGAAFAEVFDPATGMFAPGGATPVFGLTTTGSGESPTVTALDDGRVLLLGGLAVGGAPGGGDLVLGSAWLWDGRAGAGLAAPWALPFHLEVPRAAHTVTRLADGRLLVVGGYGTSPEASNERRTTVITPR